MPASPHDLLWTGYFGLDADNLDACPAPGGVILFGRNLDPDPTTGPERCAALIQALQTRWGCEAPLALALDQEGGAVSRLRPWVGDTPNLKHIFEHDGTEGCFRWGHLWGEGLALLGFNVDFAPVADLWDGHAGTGMGDRCASADPHQTAQAAGAFLSGLESTGVRGCLKHFPGLGGTRVDSHKALPELRDMDQIDRNLHPFRSLAHTDRLVMVAHLKTPATGALPASLYRGAVAQNPWGIQARWIPDDLEMGGCGDFSWDERVRLALEAGHEALLVCQTENGIAACAKSLSLQPTSTLEAPQRRFLSLRQNLRIGGPVFHRKAWKQWLDRVDSARKRH